MATIQSMTQDEPRSEYIAGLRAIADLLEQHDTVPLPYEGTTGPISWYVTSSSDQRSLAAAIVRAVGGRWDKHPGGSKGQFMTFSRDLRGMHLEVVAHRDAVCERVVVGTREVTKSVPAPDAPMVEVTEVVEDVEWVCAPLLAEASS